MSTIEANFRNQSRQHQDSSTAPPAPLKFSTAAASAHAPTHRRGMPLCDLIRAGLEAKLGANKVRRYLGAGVEMVSDNDGLHVSATNQFTIDMIEKQIGQALKDTLQDHTGNPSSSVRFSVRATQNTPTALPSHQQTPGRQAGGGRVESLVAGRAPAPARTRKNLPTCPTIEGFLVGQSNKLAHGAVMALLESSADSPGSSCPPVYIHGSCGLGKTHLLRAAAQRYRQIVPGSRVRYITGEAFTNSFVHAIRTKTVDAFEKKFKGLDVLCLDDVHLVAGKESTQQELLQIFNTLSLSGAKVIIASDAPPNEIARLNSGLASRFNGGIVARIDAPDRDLGLRLARQICLVRGTRIDDAGLGAILDRTGVGSGASVRELEGSIVQVQAVARLLEQDQCGSPTLTSIHRALQLRCGSNGQQRTNGPISIDLITKIVLEHLGVTRQDLAGRGRHRTVVLARELIVHLSRELTTCSFPEIAHSIGRPNHSTVITAAKRIRGRIENLELCSQMGPESGTTVKGLVDELLERVRMTHRQQN